jgi:hypothetical protein
LCDRESGVCVCAPAGKLTVGGNAVFHGANAVVQMCNQRGEGHHWWGGKTGGGAAGEVMSTRFMMAQIQWY